MLHAISREAKKIAADIAGMKKKEKKIISAPVPHSQQ
jgi:hypothetical protein